ncbi:MAG: 30S ribosomal protein S11 [archaeon]
MPEKKEKIKEEIEEIVEEEIEKKIPASPETKTKKAKEEAAEKVAEEVAEDVVEDLEKEIEKEKSPAKKEKRKDDKVGIAYITSSGNNTIVHITDLAGNTISRISGGMITKHSRLKANPTIAMFVAKRAAERPKDLGFTKLYIRMRGKGRNTHGPGANSAVKSLSKEGFDIISILDTTKVPRGGPKKKGGRRGRRV